MGRRVMGPQRVNKREREIRLFSNPAGRSGEMTGQEMPKRMREVALLRWFSCHTHTRTLICTSTHTGLGTELRLPDADQV